VSTHMLLLVLIALMSLCNSKMEALNTVTLTELPIESSLIQAELACLQWPLEVVEVEVEVVASSTLQPTGQYGKIVCDR
jgi:hypothetical protein